MTSRMERRVAEMLAEHTAAPGAAMLECLRWTRQNFGRDVASAAARSALAALLHHVREVDGDAATDVLAAHGVELARGRSAPPTGPGKPDVGGTGALALAVSSRLLDDLHGIQERHGGPVAVACAGSCAAAALGLVIDGLDDDALDEVFARLREVVARRQDRPPPQMEDVG